VAGLVAADVLWALGRLSLVTRRLLRLGGRNGMSDEPARLALDLLAGDARALLSGELRHIGRIA
jgi:Tfp pilus assembly protein PilW